MRFLSFAIALFLAASANAATFYQYETEMNIDYFTVYTGIQNNQVKLGLKFVVKDDGSYCKIISPIESTTACSLMVVKDNDYVYTKLLISRSSLATLLGQYSETGTYGTETVRFWQNNYDTSSDNVMLAEDTYVHGINNEFSFYDEDYSVESKTQLDTKINVRFEKSLTKPISFIQTR
jgi:hypothetical protein